MSHGTRSGSFEFRRARNTLLASSALLLQWHFITDSRTATASAAFFAFTVGVGDLPAVRAPPTIQGHTEHESCYGSKDHPGSRITRASFRGTPALYLGEDAQGNQKFSGNPEQVTTAWMASEVRARFNQHRSTRKRYVYRTGTVLSMRLEYGPRSAGHTVVDLTDKQARLALASSLAHLMVLQHPTSRSRVVLLIERRKGAVLPAPFPFAEAIRSRKLPCFHNGGQNAVLHRTGKRSGMLVISVEPGTQASRKGRWQLRVPFALSQPIRPYTTRDPADLTPGSV